MSEIGRRNGSPHTQSRWVNCVGLSQPHNLTHFSHFPCPDGDVGDANLRLNNYFTDLIHCDHSADDLNMSWLATLTMQHRCCPCWAISLVSNAAAICCRQAVFPGWNFTLSLMNTRTQPFIASGVAESRVNAHLPDEAPVIVLDSCHIAIIVRHIAAPILIAHCALPVSVLSARR